MFAVAIWDPITKFIAANIYFQLYSIILNFIITVQCQLPILNNQVIVESDNSSTEMGTVLRFKCKRGLIPEASVESVCSSGGLWLPDPEKHICHLLTATITTKFYPGVYYTVLPLLVLLILSQNNIIFNPYTQLLLTAGVNFFPD